MVIKLNCPSRNCFCPSIGQVFGSFSNIAKSYFESAQLSFFGFSIQLFLAPYKTCGTGVRGYAWVCTCVWDEFSEFLPENRVPTSADFNTYPIQIFGFIIGFGQKKNSCFSFSRNEKFQTKNLQNKVGI